jgi:aspartate aminotransferase-like enzyme
MITMSEKAWKAFDRSNLPKAYFNLQTYKANLEKGATPATPAVTLFIALQESLRLMAEEGLESIVKRHKDLAYATRRGIQALGLQVFGDEAYASPTCTAFRMPTRLDSRNLIRVLRDEHDTIIAGGQGRLEGQIARVGHMGFVTIQDMLSFFSALEQALRGFNQPVEQGAAITATLRAYAEATQPAPRTPVASRR